MIVIKDKTNILVHVILIFGSFLMIFPFIWMVMTSFKSEDEILKTGKRIVLLPDAWRPSFLNSEEDRKRIEQTEYYKKLWQDYLDGKPLPSEVKRLSKPFETFDNYKVVWGIFDDYSLKLANKNIVTSTPDTSKIATSAVIIQPRFNVKQDFYRYFLNTLFVSLTITITSLFTASLAAYAFVFFNFPYKNAIFIALLGTMMLPQQALLIPNYIILSKLNIINTYAALIIPWIASVYSVFFLRQFFLQLPKDLYEASIIDGCSKLQFYWYVLLPLSRPPMITLGLFTFLGSWNSFIWPLIVTNDAELRVIQVGLSYFNNEAGTQWGPLMAASSITILPLVILYFLAQKQFIESQMKSGLKE